MSNKVQFWLAELDRWGNPKLIDGSHDDRAGVERAVYLHQQLGFAKCKTLACVRCEITPVEASSDGVNQESLDACKTMLNYAGASQ